MLIINSLLKEKTQSAQSRRNDIVLTEKRRLHVAVTVVRRRYWAPTVVPTHFQTIYP